MKITIGPRRSGKTTRTIMKSAKTGSYILVATIEQAKVIFKQAKDMGYDIPHPVAIGEITTGRKCFDNKHMREHGVLVDEARIVLQKAIYDIPIHGMTLNNDGNIDILEHGATHTLNAANLKEYSDLRERYNHPKREISTDGKLCCSECFHIVDITDHFCSKCGQRLE